MRTISTFIVLLFSVAAFSQDIALFKNNAYGRPLYLMSNRATEGSPYYNDDYQLAQITAVNGAVYNSIKIKINLADNLIQYQAEDGQDMITDMPIKKILFTGAGGNNVLLKSIDGAINKQGGLVYEVLDSGKISLLRKVSITFRDDQKYGESTVTRIYERKEFYYYLKPNEKEQKLEKGKAAVLELFKDKKDKIAAFIDHYKLDFKTASSYKDVFNFYNSLN